ncbi:MAG: peptidoglycan bridge formation glycyltransferase FemA/FemB family protein [Acidobacteriales bacterium]|nr:peptidoglycan bridge formation glycyltransferase FemA/FemB family protein [Terriglobales bacterium]
MVQIVKQISATLVEKLPVFGGEEFLAAKGSDYGWFLSEDFVLPFVVDSRFSRIGFSRLVFTTEAVGLRQGLSLEAELEFLDEVIRICEKGKDIRVDSISTQANAVFRVVPSGSEFLDWGSYVVDLTRSEAAIFDAFHPYHKNRVRRGSGGGIRVRPTEDLDAIYENLKETMVRQGLLFYPSKNYLAQLQRRLRDRVTFYVALHEDKLQGSAVVVHNHLGGFYYYGGSISDPFPGSLNLMHYEIMKDLKGKNVPIYDFMGARMAVDDDSKLAGVQRFKSRFASSMRHGYHFRKIINPLKYRLFLYAVKAYFGLKGCRYTGDAIDQTRQAQARPEKVIAAQDAQGRVSV